MRSGERRQRQRVGTEEHLAVAMAYRKRASRRAPIIRSFSPSNRTAMANAPVSRPSAAWTAASGFIPLSRLRVIRWAMTSVSVAVSNFAPLAFELRLQLAEVLDDPVVDQRKPREWRAGGH